MRPILFVWRGVVFHSFHVLIYAALLVTVFLTVRLAQADGQNPDRVAAAVVLLFVPGFIGARLLYVVRHWDRFRGDPARILRRSEGGLSLYGGIAGVLIGAIPILWVLDLPLARFLDAFVVGIMGGVVVAKGACLLNGCCYGRATGHWCGVNLPDDRGVWRRRFPSQPIEMAWAAAVFLAMLGLRSLSPPPGAVACAAIALHPAGRLVLQKLRDEGGAEDAAVQKSCLVLIVAALVAGLALWLSSGKVPFI